MFPIEFQNPELLKVGFLSFTVLDAIDVALVTIVFYKVYQYIKGTVAAQIFIGLLVILAGSGVVSFFNLMSLNWIFSRLTSVWIIIVVILFQPEIRRLLLFLGQSRIFGQLFRQSSNDVVNETVAAVEDLLSRRIGALIVFARSVGLRLYIETGEELNARLSRRLLASLFYPNTPLHDGAVIIDNQRIEAARCILPLTQNETLSGNYGMRHRAAIGLTEVTDAFVIVLSEETGRISLAENGKLLQVKNLEDLRAKLLERLSPKSIRPKTVQEHVLAQ
ncbi:MAG: TIGR00159 family protein [[Chlorobium] sp. 445]|nr:MAG: TIGR00159 family protein [[Chlorobium] sp. 445]